MATAYTVFGSRQIHGVNPLDWVTEVITKRQGGAPQSQIDELLPYTWGRTNALTVSDPL